MCPYHKIQVWQPSQQILAMLLSHTATESHYQSRLAALELLETAQVAECLLLGFVANSAGIDKDKIRLAIIIHWLEIFLTKYFHQTFTVVTVHLAAERSDKQPPDLFIANIAHESVPVFVSNSFFSLVISFVA
jgi:hypothetical protein